MDSFTPQILDDSSKSIYATILCAFTKCGVCQTPMIPRGFPQYMEFFPPGYTGNNLDGQIRRVGWHYASEFRMQDSDARVICINCAKAGLNTFVCAHCHVERKSNEMQALHITGDPPEFLCRACYETVPASQWEKLVEGLEERHRWDWS